MGSLARLDAFQEWFLVESGSETSLKLRGGDEARRVVAVRDIAVGTTVIEVPLRNLITAEMGMATPAGCAMTAAGLRLPRDVYLAIFLIMDRTNLSSRFKTWHAVLPTTLAHMPTRWSESDCKLLVGTTLEPRLAVTRQRIAAEYMAIVTVTGNSFSDLASVHDFEVSREVLPCTPRIGRIL